MGWSLRRFIRSTAGVTNVQGTVLMTLVTVASFTGMSIGVVEHFSENQLTTHVELEAALEEDGSLLMHKGGDDISTSGGALMVNVNGIEHHLELADSRLTRQLSDASMWRIGESICISGPSPPCVYGEGTPVHGIALSYGSGIILEEGERGLPDGLIGSAGDVDLAIQILSIEPATPQVGDLVFFTVEVVNQGSGPTPLEIPIVVSFAVDDVTSIITLPGILGSGESMTVTSTTPWLAAEPGLSTVDATVDPESLLDQVRANNVDSADMDIAYGTTGACAGDHYREKAAEHRAKGKEDKARDYEAKADKKDAEKGCDGDNICPGDDYRRKAAEHRAKGKEDKARDYEAKADKKDAEKGCGDGFAICHKPGTPAEQDMTIPESAWSGHEGHGDTLGACENDKHDDKEGKSDDDDDDGKHDDDDDGKHDDDDDGNKGKSDDDDDDGNKGKSDDDDDDGNKGKSDDDDDDGDD